MSGRGIRARHPRSCARYGADGALEDWWSPATLAKFRERAECLVAQYGNLSLGTGTVDGRSLLL